MAVTTASTPRATFDVARVRRDFPILRERVYGKPLVYLDNAATAQKPQPVIDAMVRSLSEENANIHRGVHWLSERATKAFEAARVKVQGFLNAADEHEIVFVRGTTEAVNLVAQTFGRTRLQAGDEILITTLEHHSNIVPWQLLGEQIGTRLRVVPMTDAGEIRIADVEASLTPRTKLISLAHVSNSLGTIVPVEAVIEIAHARGIPVFVDGAQAVPHLQVDVQALDCDFYAFSAHKMFGPTGVGVLYGKHALLDAMPPYQGGGDMIASVSFERSTYNIVPHKFEAGTPNITGAVGLGSAVDYLQGLDWPAVQAYEQELLAYATERLRDVPGVRIVGTAPAKASVISFVMDAVHPHDIGTILDQEGVAVRTGHHCTQPVMERLGLPATVRASLAFYNTREEIDTLVAALGQVRAIFA